jgi:hypothetical protein
MIEVEFRSKNAEFLTESCNMPESPRVGDSVNIGFGSVVIEVLEWVRYAAESRYSPYLWKVVCYCV